MAGLELKEYQRESLEAIGRFCDAVRDGVGNRAVRPVHDAYYLETRRDFIEVPQLPGVPYVCLRVPTGGGKTLIAAHAVGAIAKHLGHQDRPLCLWVTPSTTIRDQTLRGLRNREHPYHAALREGLGGVPLEVLTVEESLAANRAMVSGSAVIVVTTIQSYRIDEESNRKVYQDNGYLMDHFTNLPAWVREQLAEPNGASGGRVSLSLANVMKLRGPIVIMDEAHNARTRVSFDSLARFSPLAVLELTATPQQEHDPERERYGSNVLHAVSALQLKREGMIKLPVDLESRENWLDVLALTVQRRTMLAELAATWGRDHDRFIRPIALVQAQPKSNTRETHTAERVKEALIGQLHVPAERIRICTGTNDELGDEDLRRPECVVEYIITVDKLREGWDCPFAYVLGSVGNVATATAVEQVLGRVLRMPDAEPTGIPELDRAYAIVQSEDVARTAQNLADSMVERCGFDRVSMGDVLRVHRRPEGQSLLPLSAIPVSAAPNLAQLPATVQAKVHYEPASGTIKIHEPLTRDDAQALRDVLASPADRTAVETYWQEEREVGTAPKLLDQYAKPIRLPQLAVRDGQRWLRFEPIELDEFTWELSSCDPKFTDAEFSAELHIGDHVVLDVTGQGAVRVGGVEQVITRQASFLSQDDHWEKVEVVRWLDQELHRGGQNAGLSAAESQAWLNRVVNYLVVERAVPIPILVRKRHELADLVFDRIIDHGRKQIRKAAEMLFAGETARRLETTFAAPFEIAEQDYCPYRRYSGTYSFRKHAFDLIGEMGRDDEPDCAYKIDSHPNVVRWIRNLDNESAGGFSLPLSPGRFFPDFLVELKDGRIAIVEYKGGHLAEQKKELHKEEIGKLWAARSDGRCVFVRVVDRDWATLGKVLDSEV
ncbi:type III restriction protein res subunit [Pirellula staleyi DSM 6068]|uniref:Type III restriction protein res subunit n=1 Tax=Pirellula staleyi (strain ATCC 27377 / DSM 6068 / ICPB 4128) TaxID=530564 RepID=D2R1H1_PIRSD|nr:DEAD/DEAH box helicase family protein [Pirellula staleyi]ADB14956.1 type III restriction protein res subunit [Pirellula staleyi DSM 6068]